MITGPQQMAALGEAPLAVERRELARARRPHVVEPQRAAHRRASSRRGPRTTTAASTCRPGRPTAAAHIEHDRGRRRHEASPTACSPASCSATPRTRATSAAPAAASSCASRSCTVYAGYGEGPWYVGATLGAGSLDYDDVNRNIALGAAMRTESGETRGYEYTGRLLGGYWFKYAGPGCTARTRALDVRRRPSSASSRETGIDSTALTYGQQDSDQLLSSLGWQVAGNIGGVRPFARVTWEYDSHEQGPHGDGASDHARRQLHRFPASKPDNNYALFNLGVSTDFGGVTGFIAGSATAGKRRRQLLGGHRRRAHAALTRADRAEEGRREAALFCARTARQSDAAACAARARTARRRAGAAGCAARARRAPSATAARRSACGARSRARCSRAALSGAEQERHRIRIARGHRRRDVAGTDRDDRDAGAAQLDAQALEIGDRRGLRRRIGARARQAAKPGDARDADERAAPRARASRARTARTCGRCPSTLVSKTARNAGRSSACSVSAPREMPALAMTTSGAPKRAMKSAAARASAAASRTSPA